MKKLLTLFTAIVAMSCEPQEINYSVSCELTYEKYENGLLVQTGQTLQEYYSPKTAQQLQDEFTGKARILDKYELKTTAKCIPL